MGQKVHPIGFRLGFIKDWNSRWYAGKDYGALLQEDIRIRQYINDKLASAGISRIGIGRRATDKIKIDIYAARPGVIIGRKGAEADRLKEGLEKTTGKQVLIDILGVTGPEKDAQLVAESLARQLQKRVAFRRAMKRAVTLAMDGGAKGVKIACKGRLGGAEMSRSEWYREGRVPLHTLRADIDYGTTEAKTTYGMIGVKVWIFRGEILPKEKSNYSATKRTKT